MTGLLQDRVIAVTGAGRGIGASIATMAAAEGARVIVNDLGAAVDGTGADQETAAGVVARITEAGGSAVANTGDISDYEQAGALVQQAVDAYGRLDVLVNVAGILRDKMIFNMTPEEWAAVIQVHLRGTYNTTKHASVYWRGLRDENAHHRLINFTSGSALHGAPGQPNYAAAKMGIAGLTYSCAAGLKRYGVTSNAISPDANTRMTESMGDRREHESVRSPDNIAPIVLYLASERSDWCNGQILYTSGPDIGLFNVPSLASEIFSDGPWELPAAFDQIESAFPSAVMSNRIPAMTGAGLPTEP
ncbi:SDR family oxidoreductase [Mycobacterium sp. MBM]|nr:SDR family oxidoreductase [Mycobacterium sp. MBM]